MPSRIQMLDALAYRATPALLDGACIHLRELSPGAKSLWKMFDRDYKTRMNREEAQAPHSVVTNALRCLTGGYVWFDPDGGVLATLDPIDGDTLRDAFTLMHQRVLGTPIEEIDLNTPTPLAERIADAREDKRALAEWLRRTDHGQPYPPNWLYKTIGWELSRRLSRHLWSVDGLDIQLRCDSTGGLIAWDMPWPNKTGTAHAMARIRLNLKTFPNITDPVVLVSSTASRIKRSMAYARTVLVEQDSLQRPIVEVEMAGRSRVRRINAMSLETLDRLKMGTSVLHAVHERCQHEHPDGTSDNSMGSTTPTLGRVRPMHGKNYQFSIGRGVGMHYLRELDRHIRDVFGDTAASPRIYLDGQGFKQRKPDDLLAAPQDIVRTVTAMGFDHLRLVCLWSTDENRIRMLDGLRYAYQVHDRDLDLADGAIVPLVGESISAVFHHVPDFLAHGPAAGRTEALAHVELADGPHTLVGVWAETDYHAGFDTELSEDDEDQGSGETANTRPSHEHDAKFQGRRTLAVRGAVSQFMTHRASKKKPRKNAPDRDFQAIHSVLDLHRGLGIIDPRIREVIVDELGPYKPTDLAHCGIHVRRQSKQGKDKAAKICITATVLVPPAHDAAPWTLHGWSYTDPVWRPYHAAQLAFHAQDYPTGNMTALDDSYAGNKKVARKIDDALAALSTYLRDAPYTVTVDGLATRRLWDGLHNNKQGENERPGQTWLPGSTIHPAERPAAVIRVNKDMSENLRPISVTVLRDEDTRPEKKKTTNSLYRMESDFGQDTWILVTVPKQFDGAGAGRLGADKTRWTANHGSSDESNLQKNEMKANWYSMTALEIYPIVLRPGLPPDKLSLMTARLCHQPLAWGSRTRYPVPLHSAAQMDLDHPQYRRTAPELASVDLVPDEVEDEP
ncbi:RNaseH domain-containing protein [Saccharopolyspora shandongensis]|uniref:RNaseH domain-containing protein n=1 Tax=Saccharopolyspora shandongensis TaxID=418495 RepID=UPI0034359322